MAEKNVWVQPKAVVQGFVANEYVAACWGVSCDRTDWDQAGGLHRAGFCGQPGHYEIALDNGGTPVNMIENQTDNMGDLPCTLYADGSYTTTRDISTVQSGEYIYWTTQYGDQRWLHHGTVNGVTNHS